jgi:hypothetical protein
MRKTKEEILLEMSFLTNEEVRSCAFAYLSLIDHIIFFSKNEKRRREQARLMIAKKTIQNYKNNYYKNE